MRYSPAFVLCVVVFPFIGGCDSSSGSGGVTLMELENFQPASVVIGQADFTGGDGNQNAATDANTLNNPYGNAGFANGILYVGDYSNDRVLGFQGVPQANDMPADFVLGQPDFTSNASGDGADEMNGPQSPGVSGGKLFVTDYNNNRVLIFDPAPDSGPTAATVVVGQSDFDLSSSACSDAGMSSPESHIAVDGKLIVADSSNNRVLIWNSFPGVNGEAADIVLGQQSFDACNANTGEANPTASTFDYPTGVWSDGTRLVVLDSDNNRALIWNTFPETNFEPADVVLGQADFNSNDWSAASATTFNYPYIGVASNGQQLAIADSDNHRVLVWETFPTVNMAPADVVIGQGDFTSNMPNDDDQDGSVDAEPSARTLHRPSGVHITRGGILIVSDRSNHRVLVYGE